MLSPGTRLGPYEIESPLGAGGMGEVYRARDARLGRGVAIKVLPEELAKDAQARSRFEREAKAVAALSHPNILALHDFDESNGIAYAVMELLDGETLRERLAAGALPPRKAVEFASQIAHGLAAAHERGVVHRDLKPENLFVTRDERVKILDFGLAKRQVSAEAETMELDDRTGAGTVLGTVGYMSPEQVRGEEVDARSDVFSFGAVLYEMLTAKRAFRGDSAVETMTAILKEDPPELAGSGRQLPPGLDRIVRHCLEKPREVRFQSARDLAFDLESVAAGSTTGSLAPLEAARRSVPKVALGAVALVAALALFAGWAIGHRANGGREAATVYQKLTYQRGAITGARLAPDGQTFAYSATWEGKPLDVFVGRIGSPDSRALGLTGATLLSISNQGVLAITLGWHYGAGFEAEGTLATVPLDGGAPRKLLDHVLGADWGPDGKVLAVAHFNGDSCRLEFPIGKPLVTTVGWMSDVHVSSDGQRVAYIDHPNRGDSLGRVSVVDLAGHVRALSTGENFPQGLSWSPDGRELWFGQNDGRVMAVDLTGRERTLAAQPGPPSVADVAAGGRLLFLHSTVRRESMVRFASGAQHDLSWFDWTFPEDLSRDGKTLLFEEQLVPVEDGYAIYLRSTDGSPAVRIGEGRGLAISPDGQWVLTLRHPFGDKPELVLVPTGAGEARVLADDGIRYQGWGGFLPDGKSVLIFGSLPGQPLVPYLRSLEPGGKGRPLSRQPVRISSYGLAISPDGREIALVLGDGRLVLQPLDGSAPTPIPGSKLTDEPLQFTPDGKALLVTQTGAIPMPIERLDLATGARSPFLTLEPVDPAGVAKIGPVYLGADDSTIVYSYIRFSDELYLANGVR